MFQAIITFFCVHAVAEKMGTGRILWNLMAYQSLAVVRTRCSNTYKKTPP